MPPSPAATQGCCIHQGCFLLICLKINFKGPLKWAEIRQEAGVFFPALHGLPMY